MAVTAVSTKSPTFDEPTHFAAGYSYWLRHDFRLDPESGNLPQRWATLPLLFTHPKFVSTEAESWRAADQGAVGSEFLYDVGNNPELLLGEGRRMMAVVSAALCLVVYFWSKELFGATGGLISASLVAFCPSFLGHGALVTSDVTLALFFALSLRFSWRMLNNISLVSVTLAALSLSGLFLSKMSAPCVLVMVGIMVAVRLSFSGFVPAANRSGRQWILLLGLSAVIAATVVTTIWAAYDFRYSAISEPPPASSVDIQRWTTLLSSGGPISNAIALVRDYHLLPEAYIYGFAYAWKTADFRPSYLDGRWSLTGFVDFFPRAFCYKTPLPVIALLFLAMTALILWIKSKPRRVDAIRTAVYRTTPIWTLVLVYGAYALSARLNIGHRHILPLYPPLFVACGSCAYFFRRNLPRILAISVALLLVWHGAESLSTWPNYLAYFNQLAGGSKKGFKHLVDSSCDWGQDLPALKAWLVTRTSAAADPTYLAYFGTARPEWYKVRATSLPSLPARLDEPIAALRGGLYCISATVLQQVYARAMGPWKAGYEQRYLEIEREVTRFSKSGANSSDREALLAEHPVAYWLAHIRLFQELQFARLCADLRHRTPIAQPGYSILIFKLTDDEVSRAVDGPAAELFPDDEVSVE